MKMFLLGLWVIVSGIVWLPALIIGIVVIKSYQVIKYVGESVAWEMGMSDKIPKWPLPRASIRGVRKL